MNNRQKKGQSRKSIHERKKSLDSIKVLMKKNPSKAKAELIRELNEHSEDMYCWFYYGQVCQAESNLEEAEYAYTKVADSTSWNKYAGVVGLADIARIKGDIQKAKKLYRKAIAEHPRENSTTYYMLARLETNDGNFEEALRLLNKLDPNCNETMLEKARTYIEFGDMETAKTITESITPINEIEKRNLAYAKAKICINNGDYKTAEYYFLEARECKIKDAQYYKILSEEARLAVETGNYQLAIDNCEECFAKKEIAFGDNYFILGLAKQGIGQYQSAIDCFKTAITENGISYFPKTACCYHLARIQILMGEIDVAERTLKSSFTPEMPPRSSIIDLLLNIYIKQGRYSEAKELIAFARQTLTTPEEINRLVFSSIIIASKTGAVSKEERTYYSSYRERQAVAYSKTEAIEHIINHHQLGESLEGVFPKDKNIEELYDEIQEQLTEENRTVLDVVDRYFIDYPNAGYSPTGEILHRIGVVTIPGTKDIITMYPDIDYVAQRLTTKDVIAQVNANQKVATDRISKFNSKFANFTPPKK